MPASRKSRIGVSRHVLGAVLAPLVALGVVSVSGDAQAQIAGTTNKPLPNVLLLVDTSGSMERMPDNSLPSADRPPLGGFVGAVKNKCQPGVESNPNRWGMLLQALTGNLQPFFSCAAIDRTTPQFKNEFEIGSAAFQPYDADYFLPYHRPLTGSSPLLACANAPFSLPGAAPGSGVGPGHLGSGGDARDLPPDAFTQVFYNYLQGQYGVGPGSALVPAVANMCTYDQANDGQLDAARDYVRFGLMTFDNAPDPSIGVTISTPPSGNVVATNPFTGQWTYVKSASNGLLSSTPSPLAMALPANCSTGPVPFDVGARHSAAPPWEGRMVPFPAPDATIYDIEATNDAIQKVLLGTRPYGATPIEGMLEDARDYLWFNPQGPLAPAPVGDPYVNVSCRDEYIILLTDGAPNLDFRPSCEQSGAPNGQCPFNKSAVTVDAMANGAGGKKVTTYVIGFSVNGATGTPADGFPSGITDCKTWYQTLGGNPTAMRNACTSPPAAAASIPPKGSTADACCQLNEIAYWGDSSHTIGPYFAETQADLVLSFGRILGSVSKSATTRTVPTYAPTVSVPALAPGGYTADFVASFIPNARKVWSGEIDRTRSICQGVVPTPQVPQSVAAGDSYATNTAAQSATGRRLFISVQAPVGAAAPPGSGAVIDSARTIRPYANAAPIDLLPSSLGTEVAGLNQVLAGIPNWAEALDIDNTTCKRSKAVQPGTGLTQVVPSLNKSDCTDITWGFATANAAPMVKSNNGFTYDFNVRCTAAAGGLGAGNCSSSGVACSTASPTACTVPGEVCVPQCAALGAIYRSTPAVVGLPDQFLRDDAYLQFLTARSTAASARRPVMYVATTDGLLHAFKALATTGFDAHDYELWSFIPPAVLPKLSSNFPTGQQILLDGSPVVRDMVWDRKPTDVVTANLFHTTLVAGMGAGGAGYYGLNVTDADCGGFPASNNACIGNFTPATTKTQAAAPNGPHFLWQLTDVPYDGVGDPAKQGRKAKDGTQMVSLFGAQSGTPALATLQVDPGDGGGARQIGVAILPGGMDGPPIKNQTCNRAMDGGASVGYNPAVFDASDPAFARRTTVRAWGSPCATGPVPGRGLTIVRADTGEIIRHFGRATQDVPRKLLSRTTDTPFDSPIIGTPAVYPNIIGATAQKIYVGDADGTMWRIDVTSPTASQWSVTMFQDLVSRSLPSTPGAAQSEPINIPPVLSLDPTGGIIINAATGDQENLVANATETNYIFSLQEQRPTVPGLAGQTSVRWYRPLTGGERVTGPMAIFDRTLYFATYTPTVPMAGACSNDGNPFLYGMDFFNPNTGGMNLGGVPRWCPIGSVDPVSGACLVGLIPGQNPVGAYPGLLGAIIPGVTVRAQQSCVIDDGTAGDPNITGLTQTKFDLFFGATAGRTTGGTGTPQAYRPDSNNLLTRPLPRTTAVVDAWALVVD